MAGRREPPARSADLARDGRAELPRERGTELAGRILAGDRRALSTAITLVESTLAADRVAAEGLLDSLGDSRRGVRIGVTGLTGAGKSTLIEAVGTNLADSGLNVAVLAVDPTSPRAGGSLLGDKLRMERLSRHPSAFVRPSPSGSHGGALSGATEDAATLCEAAGYDVVFVETVGAGQSDWEIASLVDFLVAVLLPGGGDEVQGLKRGLLEFVDLLVVTRGDGETAKAARRTREDYEHAVALLRDPPPSVVVTSAPTGVGVVELADQLRQIHASSGSSVGARRSEQRLAWFRHLVRRFAVEAFLSDADVQRRLEDAEQRVRDGTCTARNAARQVVAGRW